MCTRLNSDSEFQIVLFIFISIVAGSSVYFSHCLQLLFFSYAQGINLVASFEHDYSTLKHIMPIIYKNAKTPVTLYQWTESHLQPGLICALSQSNISPVIIFLLSNTINIYDFKLDSTKSKVQGIVLNVNMKNLSVEGISFVLVLFLIYFQVLELANYQ